jgi:ATP/maltotriose-dependent transcriptional regulator MalT
VAEAAGAGIIAGELAAARWLDAEDATMAHVLAWAVEHDLDTAVRLVRALSMWWVLRGRLAGQQPLLRELARRSGPGSEGWCTAQFWLGWIAFEAADLPGALQRCTAVIDLIADQEPTRLLVDCLHLQSAVTSNLGQVREAAAISRRALAMARELGYPFGQAFALNALAIAASYGGDPDDAAQLARQAMQIPDVPGTGYRVSGYLLAAMLTEAGDLAAAEQACAAALAQARDAGDLHNLAELLPIMADLALRAGRTADAAAHLREATRVALQTGIWMTMLNAMEGCGYLCAATGRPADAITVWAARDRLSEQGGFVSEDADGRREDALRVARHSLGPDRARAAEERGKAMGLAAAAEYVLMLTGPESLQPQAPRGPSRLSARERELVTLVAQGSTDADIAGQLYISIRTVRSHLDRIRDKTGCRRRADLTRLALAEGLV